MQYLFNAPEGYARLVLEHKTRPSAKLQALFALQPQALVRRRTGQKWTLAFIPSDPQCLHLGIVGFHF
jgi:hypothetical protein